MQPATRAGRRVRARAKFYCAPPTVVYTKPFDFFPICGQNRFPTNNFIINIIVAKMTTLDRYKKHDDKIWNSRNFHEIKRTIVTLLKDEPYYFQDTFSVQRVVDWFCKEHLTLKEMIHFRVFKLLCKSSNPEQTFKSYQVLLTNLIRLQIYLPNDAMNEMLVLSKIEQMGNDLPNLRGQLFCSSLQACMLQCRPQDQQGARAFDNAWARIKIWLSWFQPSPELKQVYRKLQADKWRPEVDNTANNNNTTTTANNNNNSARRGRRRNRARPRNTRTTNNGSGTQRART